MGSNTRIMAAWKILAAAISLSVLVLALAIPANAVVLCAKQRKDDTFNTSVKIREVCKTRETQLDLGGLGLVGSAGSFVVQDGLGNTIGTLLGRGPGTTTLQEPTTGKALTMIQSTDATGVVRVTFPIAMIRFAEGDFSEGEVLLKRTLAIWEKALGSEHPRVAICLESLAALYDQTGRSEKVAPAVQRAVRIRAISNASHTALTVK